MSNFIVSANRTDTGRPVYLDTSGGWCFEFGAAHIFASKADTAEALAQAHTLQAFICDPFVMKVKMDGDLAVPSITKWAIRRAGADETLSSLGYPPDEYRRTRPNPDESRAR